MIVLQNLKLSLQVVYDKLKYFIIKVINEVYQKNGN